MPHQIIWSWYTGHWWVGCYIWYSNERTGWGLSPPRPFLTVPNVTSHPLTASVLITVLLCNGLLLCGFDMFTIRVNCNTVRPLHLTYNWKKGGHVIMLFTVLFQLWFFSYTVSVTVIDFFIFSVKLQLQLFFSVTITVIRFFNFSYSYFGSN